MLITSSRITVRTEAPENTYSHPSRCSVRPPEAIGTIPVIEVETEGRWFTLVHLQYLLFVPWQCYFYCFIFVGFPFVFVMFFTANSLRVTKKNFNKIIR